VRTHPVDKLSEQAALLKVAMVSSIKKFMIMVMGAKYRNPCTMQMALNFNYPLTNNNVIYG
jgi:hypothetical protein